MQLFGLIFQWDTSKRDPLLIVRWIFFSSRSPKAIFTTLEMTAHIIIRARVGLLIMAKISPLHHSFLGELPLSSGLIWTPPQPLQKQRKGTGGT